MAISPQGWRGVLRDAYGEIIWSCEHVHRYRGTQSQDSAVCCACAELRRRDAAARPRKRKPTAG